MRSVAVFVVLLVAALPALASHDKTDVVTTNDGATYIGEIKSVQYATLSFKTSPAGTIAIEWRYVTGMTSKFIPDIQPCSVMFIDSGTTDFNFNRSDKSMTKSANPSSS